MPDFSLKTLRILLAVLIALTLGGSAHAQTLTVTYPRFDVDLAIQRDGSIQVTETQTVAFSGRTSSRAFTEIPLTRLDDITDITVGEPGKAYRSATTRAPETFQAFRQRDSNGVPVVRVEWSYPASTQRTFVLRYRVVGAVRIYDAGDQLYWTAIRGGRAGPVANSRVTVRLPAAVDASRLQAEAALGGRNEWRGRVLDGQTVEFTAQNIAPDTPLEVRVQFPHGLVTSLPPSWQAEVDRQEVFEQNIRPLINLGSLMLGLLIAIGGGLWVVIAFFTRGRDPSLRVANVPVLVREPPSDLPPAVVGTLLDERADTQDVLATLIDLANRNIISISEEENKELLGSHLDFRFELLQPLDSPSLRPYEKSLLQGLFGSQSEFRLSRLKGKLYATMPDYMRDLYAEVTRMRLFIGNPDSIRRRYRTIGTALAGIGGVGFFFALCALMSVGGLTFMPFLGLLFAGGLFLLVAPHMPKRTLEGLHQTTIWRGFRDYLANIQKHEPIDQATTLFNRYLPYAVAFGIDQSWVNKFATVGTPAPPWFRRAAWGQPDISDPYGRGSGPVIIMPGGGWGHGGRGYYGGGSSGEPGGAPGAGGGTPRNLSEVSDSLADMLSRASETLARGGGSGWSGGGGGWGGGGGGGGGSSGFD